MWAIHTNTVVCGMLYLPLSNMFHIWYFHTVGSEIINIVLLFYFYVFIKIYIFALQDDIVAIIIIDAAFDQTIIPIFVINEYRNHNQMFPNIL